MSCRGGRLRHIFRLGEPVHAPADPGEAVKQRSLDIEPGNLFEALRRLVGGERLQRGAKARAIADQVPHDDDALRCVAADNRAYAGRGSHGNQGRDLPVEIRFQHRGRAAPGRPRIDIQKTLEAEGLAGVRPHRRNRRQSALSWPWCG